MVDFAREPDMAGLGKQAKILTDKQVALALAAVATRRYPLRDGVIILLILRQWRVECHRKCCV